MWHKIKPVSAYTIIVPDNAVLQRVCGTNDSNLKLIESFLGVPVFACGNELSVETGSNSAVEQQFRFIIDRILDEISCSDPAVSDKDLIQSVLNTGTFSYHKSSSRSFAESAISIPGGVKKVYPRTQRQASLVQAMRQNDIVIASGPAGTGKTFLMVAEALRLVLSHQKNSIVLTRPVVEAGENLGFLPGDLQDKINPYVRPLYDAMNAVLHRDTVRKMTESGIIEVAPLAYMRGRTLNDSVIILDEAQNATCAQMKLLLTRMGEGSKVFIAGDITQIDLPSRGPSGLVQALDILEGIPGIASVHMKQDDVVRNPLVKKIIQAYENEN